MSANLQLWSCYYDPEPTGIAPVSAMLARSLQGASWRVEVVAAHPHYPAPIWGRRRRPWIDHRDGIRVLRVPLWIGRETAAARIRQELSFAASLLVCSPLLGRPVLSRPDLMLVASPSFPALLPALVNSRVRRIPMILWLHDILPEGATSSGLLDEDSVALRASRRLERAAYQRAERIVVLSAPFRENLIDKGVPAEKIELIYDPATLGVPERPPRRVLGDSPRVLSMGNIGLTQGLAPLVEAFEASAEMERREVRLVITGDGVAAPAVRTRIASDRVEMLGVVDDARLERELARADLALVSQSYQGTEFNLPSKLMNFMAQGLPILAAVNPASEVARLIGESGAGWVVDSSRPELFPKEVTKALSDPVELERRGGAGHTYAMSRFSPEGFAASFDRLLEEVVSERSLRR
jgi:colanic acid biosynthesis glycosyl transferase WcaI